MRSSLSINENGNPIHKLEGLKIEFPNTSVTKSNTSEGRTEKFTSRKVGGLRGGC